MKRKHSAAVRPLIEAARTEGPTEQGLEYQQERGWPKLALCPIWAHRDEAMEAEVNWDTLLAELPSDKHYGIVRIKSPGHGWHECVYFNPCHRKTERVVLDVLRRIRQDGCADLDELAAREIQELTECVWRSIELPDGVKAGDVALALRSRDDWDGNDSYCDAKAYEEIQEIPHLFDAEIQTCWNEAPCVCGLPAGGLVHRDPADFEQAPGQLMIPGISERGVFVAASC